MKSTSLFLLISVTVYVLVWLASDSINLIKENRKQGNTPPMVEILMPEAEGKFNWNAQIRYEINISDLEDGDSRYGEINPNEVLLEIEYLPNDKGNMEEQIKKTQTKQETIGLSLIRTSTCFGCHADKTRLGGPSFSEIAERYDKNPTAIENLGSSIVNGSQGIWGGTEMPANPDFTQDEAMQIAEYILEQGGNNHRWVYPGLDGFFRVIERPVNDSHGVYVLRASYTDHGIEGIPQSQIRSQHSIVLKIR